MASRVLKKGKNRLTQGYKSTHKGVDLGREHLTGEPVIAHTAGKVTFCQTGKTNNKGSTGNASYGNCVKLDHGDGYETLYAHLDRVYVSNGERVATGQTIGTMGNTGNSYGTHLHFEVRKDGQRIDPTPYLASNLPLTGVKYRVCVGKRWLPWVSKSDDTADGYAGLYGQAITAVQIVPDSGTVTYRVHQIEGDRWLPWVTSEKGYAGNRGKPIDGVQCTAEGVTVRYRVTARGAEDWQVWRENGDRAGVSGVTLDGVQIRLERG